MLNTQYDVDIIKAKIKLKRPLTAGEYAFAILYLHLDPKAYSLKNEKEQTEQAKMPKIKKKKIRSK